MHETSVNTGCMVLLSPWVKFPSVSFPRSSLLHTAGTSPGAQMVNNLPAMWETWVRSLGQEDPLEKAMAIHSSILAWRIPWTEEPTRLQSTGSPWVRQECATNATTTLLLCYCWPGLELPCGRPLWGNRPAWVGFWCQGSERCHVNMPGVAVAKIKLGEKRQTERAFKC